MDTNDHDAIGSPNNPDSPIFNCPQYIVDPKGRSLNLSLRANARDGLNNGLSYPFHGGDNQQWVLVKNEIGEVALRSKRDEKTFVGMEDTPRENANLTAVNYPFFWKMYNGDDNPTVAGSEFAVTLASPARLRTLSDKTRLYLLQVGAENEKAILREEVKLTGKVVTFTVSAANTSRDSAPEGKTLQRTMQPTQPSHSCVEPNDSVAPEANIQSGQKCGKRDPPVGSGDTQVLEGDEVGKELSRHDAIVPDNSCEVLDHKIGEQLDILFSGRQKLKESLGNLSAITETVKKKVSGVLSEMSHGRSRLAEGKFGSGGKHQSDASAACEMGPDGKVEDLDKSHKPGPAVQKEGGNHREMVENSKTQPHTQKLVSNGHQDTGSKTEEQGERQKIPEQQQVRTAMKDQDHGEVLVCNDQLNTVLDALLEQETALDDLAAEIEKGHLTVNALLLLKNPDNEVLETKIVEKQPTGAANQMTDTDRQENEHPVPSSHDKIRKPDIMIAVMGPTGTGKSSFIQLITGDKKIKVGHGVKSETVDISLAHCFESDGRCITFVDTPGFDDSREGVTDTIVLQKIAAFLEIQFKDKKKLNGIVYLHRISDPKMGGITIRNLRMFMQLCGTDVLKNVVILTTRWDNVDEKEGSMRELELMTNVNFFKPLVDAKARFLRHDGTLESARRIMLQLLVNDPLVLQIQKELAEGKKLIKTAAGSELTASMNTLIKHYKLEKQNILKDIEDAKTEKSSRKGLEEKSANISRKIEKWNTEKNRLDEGMESVRKIALAEMEAATLQREGQRRLFLSKQHEQDSFDGSSRSESQRGDQAREERSAQQSRMPGQMQNDVMIAIMGATGTGKSSLIQLIVGKDMKHHVELQKSGIAVSRHIKPDGACVTFADIPDCVNHGRESDVLFLQEVANFFQAEYKDGRKLHGLIYTHRIVDEFGCAAEQNLQILEKLCGKEFFKNIIVVTTRWDQIKSDEGVQREQKLEAHTIKRLAGARLLRHNHTLESAHRIMEQLSNYPPSPFRIQKELAEGKRLVDTTAGSALQEQLASLIEEYGGELEIVRDEMQEANARKDGAVIMKLKEKQNQLEQWIAWWKAEKKRLEQA